MIGITVIKSGPWFDGRAAHAIDQALDESARRTAQLGASVIRAEQARTYRHETPYDRLQNVAEPNPPGWKIWDRNVIYGPWLEGTGSRNFPRTRFRGYAIYRRNFQLIDRRAGVIAEYTFKEFEGAMN